MIIPHQSGRQYHPVDQGDDRCRCQLTLPLSPGGWCQLWHQLPGSGVLFRPEAEIKKRALGRSCRPALPLNGQISPRGIGCGHPEGTRHLLTAPHPQIRDHIVKALWAVPVLLGWSIDISRQSAKACWVVMAHIKSSLSKVNFKNIYCPLPISFKYSLIVFESSPHCPPKTSPSSTSLKIKDFRCHLHSFLYPLGRYPKSQHVVYDRGVQQCPPSPTHYHH